MGQASILQASPKSRFWECVAPSRVGRGRGVPGGKLLKNKGPEALDVRGFQLQRPDLAAFSGLDALGLEVAWQLAAERSATLSCSVVEVESWRHRCDSQSSPRGTVPRRIAPPLWVAANHSLSVGPALASL